MANICEYHILVKGNKNACYALFGAMPVIMGDEKTIESEEGKDNDYQMVFTGRCKWSIDSYTERHDEIEVQTIPLDPEEAVLFGEDFWHVSLQGKSRIFQVEAWCNSVDRDDFNGIFSEYCNRGEEKFISYSEMPEQIAMTEFEEYDEEFGNWEDSLVEMNEAVWELDFSTVKRIIEQNSINASLENDEDNVRDELTVEIMVIAENEDRLPMEVFSELNDKAENIVTDHDDVPATMEELKEQFYGSYERNGVVHIKDLNYDFSKKVKTLIIPGIIDGKNVVIDEFFECPFSGCNMAKKMEEVVFLDGVIEIGMMAFSECKKLKKVTFAKTIKKVGLNAFDNTPWALEQTGWREQYGFAEN